MGKIVIGVIGCGVISKVYLKNIQELFTGLAVKACADMDLVKAKQTALEFGIPKACTPEELLEDEDIQIVLNLTIPAAHKTVNCQILHAGKHVYCEKPLALSLKEAQETICLAREKGLLLGCAPDTFLGAGLQTCRQLLDQGVIGKPIAATANMLSHGVEDWHTNPEFYYKSGGGPMLDMAPYYLTALVSLLGSIKRVSCMAGKGYEVRRILTQPLAGKEIAVEVPTHFVGLLEFAGGVLSNLTMSFDVWRSGLPMLEIYGTEGSLIVPDPNCFGGEVRVLRCESFWKNGWGTPVKGGKKLPGGNERPTENPKFYEKVALCYQQPRENMRGIGLMNMALAVENRKNYGAFTDLAYHVTEAMLTLLDAAEDGQGHLLTSGCERPQWNMEQ